MPPQRQGFHPGTGVHTRLDVLLWPPAGSIHKDSPAARFLTEKSVARKDFNSYGSRRGNDEIMARGTFANIRLVNKFLGGEVGPQTIHVPTKEKMSVFDAAMVGTDAITQYCIALLPMAWGECGASDHHPSVRLFSVGKVPCVPTVSWIGLDTGALIILLLLRCGCWCWCWHWFWV